MNRGKLNENGKIGEEKRRKNKTQKKKGNYGVEIKTEEITRKKTKTETELSPFRW